MEHNRGYAGNRLLLLRNVRLLFGRANFSSVDDRVVTVALANKLARIAWAIMTSGDLYRREAQSRRHPAGAGDDGLWPEFPRRRPDAHRLRVFCPAP